MALQDTPITELLTNTEKLPRSLTLIAVKSRVPGISIPAGVKPDQLYIWLIHICLNNGR